jgi:AraC-like DNA-binding protein
MTQRTFEYVGLGQSPLGGVARMATKRSSSGAPPAFCSQNWLQGLYLLDYTLAGTGRFTDAAGQSLDLTCGDMLMVRIAGPCSTAPAGDQPWDETFILAHGPLMETWQKAGLIGPRPRVVPTETPDYWQQRLQAVGDPTLDETPQAMGVRLARLQEVLAEMAHRHSPPPSAEDGQAWLARVRGLLAQRRLNEPTLTEVARQLGMHYDSFRRKFKRLAGISPHQARIAHFVRLAAQLLADETLSLAEIAVTLGFADEYHLSKRFKQQLGAPPTAWRNRSRKPPPP